MNCLLILMLMSSSIFYFIVESKISSIYIFLYNVWNFDVYEFQLSMMLNDEDES